MNAQTPIRLSVREAQQQAKPKLQMALATLEDALALPLDETTHSMARGARMWLRMALKEI